MLEPPVRNGWGRSATVAGRGDWPGLSNALPFLLVGGLLASIAPAVSAAEPMAAPAAAGRPPGPTLAAADEVDEALIEPAPVSNRAVVGPSAAEVPAAAEKKSEAARSWRLLPIFWSGSLASDLGFSGGDSGRSSVMQAERLALNANSYLWQPWFARVGGSLFLARSTVSAETRSSTNSLGLGGRLSLFPVSRFPVEAYLDTTSTTSSSGDGASPRFSSVLLGASNTYRPEDGSYLAGGNFQHSRFDSGGGATSSLTTINASYSPKITTEMPQTLSADGSFSIGKSESPAADKVNAFEQDLSTLRLRLAHTINLEDWYGLTLTSEASYDSNSRRASGGNEMTTSIAQAQTNFNWQPDEDIPLRLSGSIRAQQFTTLTADQEFSIQSLQANVATSYRLSERWMVSGGLSSTFVSSDSASAASLGGNVGLSYNGALLDFAGFAYTHGASLSGSASVDSNSSARFGLGAGFNHGLGRQLSFGAWGPLALNLSQSYSASTNSGGGSDNKSYGVGTNASASWSMPGLRQASLSAMVSVSDSRTFGDNSSTFQNLNASATGSLALTAYSSFTLGANAGFSRRIDEARSDPLSDPGAAGAVTSSPLNCMRLSFIGCFGPTSGTPAATLPTSPRISPSDWIGFGSVQVGYQNSRFFSVPRLEYSATYNLTARSGSSLANSSSLVTAIADHESGTGLTVDHMFVQYLNYRLGRLSFRLSNNIALANDGKMSGSVFLSVIREMGGVLRF